MGESVADLIEEVSKEIHQEETVSFEQYVQIIALKIGNELFGVDILQINEIVRVPKITRIPDTPESIKGLMNLRGNVIPVIDLRVKFNLDQKEQTELTRIVVVEIKGKLIALYVDEVSEVIRLSKTSIEPPPPILKGIVDKYILGVGKNKEQLIILVNLVNIMIEEGIISE